MVLSKPLVVVRGRVAVELQLAAAAQSRRMASSRLWPGLAGALCRPVANSTGVVALPKPLALIWHGRSFAMIPREPPLHGPVPWQVHKFGGASLADAKKMKACGDLLITEARGDGEYAPTAAVVSAMKGMTNHLVEMVTFATQADGEEDAVRKLDEIVQRQVGTVNELVGSLRPDIAERIVQNIERDRSTLATMIKSFTHLHEVPASAMAYVAGTGEVWSAQTLCGYLEAKGLPTQWLNARDVLIVESDDAGLGSKGAAVDMSVEPLYDVTSDNLQKWWRTTGKAMHDGDPIMIITGFVASTPQGVCTTLKRSGSDHTATIFAYLLKASRVTLWKEVDGIFTTDPFKVPSAGPLSSLSYEEANEIAYFGGEVLHPAATLPCMLDNIPIYVRNFLNPAFEGTIISSNEKREEDLLGAIKGITYIENIAMVNIDGGGWGSVTELTQRVMGAMGKAGIKVMLVTQNSSKHSLSLAVDQAEAQRALVAMQKTFELELLHKHIGGVDVQSGFSILSMVSSDLKEHSGLAVPFFKALGRIRCNITAVAQGPVTLSVVVAKSDLQGALHVAHHSYEPMSKDMSVCVLGHGKVGTELLTQISGYKTGGRGKSIQEVNPVGVRVHAIVDSKSMLLHETGLNSEHLTKAVQDQKEHSRSATMSETDIDTLTDFMVRKAPNAVIVDCTGSAEIIAKYPKFLQRGVHVVSANKRAGSAEWDFYCRTFNAARKGESRWFYEASVGSGLLISTIQDLLRTGDTIHQIEGIFSGTLSYIFNNLGPDKEFSDAVADAQAKGFTEPDPRDDLSGMDVQRKVVILAREAGLEINLEDVHVETLVPESLVEWQAPEGENCATAFTEELKAFDASWAEKVSQAGTDVLRYVGVVDVANGTARVELRRYPRNHAFAVLQDIDNICLFSTDRFSSQPLMVRGPGTGKAVIAGGVFADLLRLGSVVRAM